MLILLAGVILFVSGIIYGSVSGVADDDATSLARKDSGGVVFLGVLLIFFGVGVVMKDEHPFQMGLRDVQVLSIMLLWLDVLIRMRGDRVRDDARPAERPASLRSALRIAYGGGFLPPPKGAGATYLIWSAQVVLWGLFLLCG